MNEQSAEIIRIGVEIAMGLIGFFAVSVLASIKKSIDDTRKSVDELNVKVAFIIEKTAWHEKTMDSHNNRITILEGRVHNGQ